MSPDPRKAKHDPRVVGRPHASDQDFAGAPLLRKEFTLDAGHGDGRRGGLHVTAHGVVEPTLNGTSCPTTSSAPGWSSYEWRLRYATYDVTAARWPRPRCWGSRSATAGTAADSAGTASARSTAPSWPAWPSCTSISATATARCVGTDTTGRPARPRRRRTTSTTARPSTPGWPRTRGRRPGADLTGWVGVHVVELDAGRLQPYVGPPVRRQEVLRPVAGLDLARRLHPRRLRAEPRRLAALHRRRGRPAPRSPCATRRCSRTTNSAPARCARRGRRIVSSSAAARTRSSRPRPSTASATPR